MALIFISHSSKDNELVKWYKNRVEEYGFKSIFLDLDEKDGIQINEAWEERLYRELGRSKVILCLVSKNWIESCWCQKEYSIAKTLNKETILVSIEEEPQHKKEVFQWIGEHIQQIDIADNLEAFEKVLKHIDELTRKVFDKPYAWDENKNPYPGLLPFTEDMAAVFYGREDETDAVIAELNDPKSLASVHALLIVGASGMGKSSLLQAGILPKLKTFEEYRKKWHILSTIRPGKDPLGKMLRLLINEAITDSEEAGEYYERLKEEIQGDQFEASIEKLFDRILLKYPNKKILLPIDQAEEFFTLSDKKEKELFFKLLSWIFEHRDTFYTIWTIRSDQIERFQTEASLDTIRKYHAPYLLTPIKEEHISTIIKYPAYKSDIVLEESLIERMRQDLKDSKALPLLAYTLNELTKDFFANDARQKPRVVKLDDYLALAKESENPIYAIVERKIETLLSKPKRIDALLDKEKLLEETKRLFLYHLIDIDIDGKPSKKIAIKGELSPLMCKVADAFVQERLLVSSSVQIGDGSDTTVPTYEIAHESIIHNWPQLQEWINEEKEFFIVRAQVRVAMKEWQKADESKKVDALLGGLLLEKAQKFLDKAWSETEKRYIQKSIDQAQKIDKRKRNFLIGSFTTISALAGFGYYEFFQARENAKRAEEKKRQALAEAKRANHNEQKMKEELERAEHNLGLVLLEKMQLALKNKEIPKAQLFAYASLLKIKEKYDTTNAKARAKSIIISYEDRAISSLIGHKDSVKSIAISPDGKTIVSGSWDNTIKIWDLKCLKENKALSGHNEFINSIAYSPTGINFSSASWGGWIDVWDSKDYNIIESLKKDKEMLYQILSISYSPDGKTIASGIWGGWIEVWNIYDKNTNKLSISFKGHSERVNAILFSSDGKTIISGSSDGTIKIWDAKNFRIVNTLNKFGSGVRDMCFLNDAQTIIVGLANGNIIGIDAHKYIKTYEIKGDKYYINSIAYSPSGNIMASTGSEKSVKLWDTKNFTIVSILKGHKKSVNEVLYSPDGKTIISSSNDSTVKLWSAESCLETTTLKSYYIDSICYSLDEKTFASASNDYTIRIYNAVNFKEIATLKGHESAVSSILYSPDGRNLISSSWDNTIRIWDLYNFKELKKVELDGYRDIINGIAISPDGNYIVSCSNKIEIFNINNLKKIATLEKYGLFSSVTYSHNGSMIAVGTYDGEIIIYNTISFERIISFTAHKENITSIVFSPDNLSIISSSGDSTIKIWDIQSFNNKTILKGHNGNIEKILYSPNGRNIVSCSSDKTIKIWDSENFNEIATLYGHKDIVLSIGCSPDSKYIISGSLDNTIKIWDLQKLASLDNSKYLKQNIKRLEQFVQVKLDGITLKDATIPPLSTKESYPKHHPFYWIDDAENGNAEAMYQLGLIYDRDNENNKALEWYKKALKAGYKPAKERIAFLEKWMAEHPEKSNKS